MTTNKPGIVSLSDIVADDVFVGTSLILRKGDRFLYGLRPWSGRSEEPVVELSGIGGGLEAEDGTLWGGAQRGAQEERGCPVRPVPCQQTLIVRGRNDVERVQIAGRERPAAVVFRHYRTPPHQPWHERSQDQSCLIVFLAELLGEPWPAMELPCLLWLGPEQILSVARADVPLGRLLQDGATLVRGESDAPPQTGLVRLTDSQEALALALDDRAPSFYLALGDTLP
jgi:hypothetical protein